MPVKFESIITDEKKYGPAMEITSQEEADEYFEACVQHTMSHGKTREEAEEQEKSNLAYFSGYCDHETMKRVQKLFNCIHPILGDIEKTAPTLEDCFRLGMEAGERMKKGLPVSTYKQPKKIVPGPVPEKRRKVTW